MLDQNNHSYEILNNLPIGVCIVDDLTRVIVWNDILCKWTNLQPIDVIGSELTALFPELANKSFYDRLSNLFKDGIPFVYTAAMHRYFLPIQQFEGEQTVFMSQETVIRLLSYNPPRAMICIEDVSTPYTQLTKYRTEVKERRSKEILLQQRNQTLQKITQLQTNIIKQVSHEEFYQQIIKEFTVLFNSKTIMVLKACSKSNNQSNSLDIKDDDLATSISDVAVCRYKLRAWYNYNEDQDQCFTGVESFSPEHQQQFAQSVFQHFFTQEIKKGVIESDNNTVTGLLERKFHRHLTLPIINGEDVLALIVVSINDFDIDEETIAFLNPVLRTIGQLLRTRRAEAQRAHAMLELKLNAQRLENAKREAELATRTKSEFLANMSHEIRTPMTAIIGFTEVLMEHDLTQDETKSTISIIRKNGEHLLTLINDILDISKIEAGKMSMEKISFSPVLEAQQVLDLMRSRAEIKHLSLDMVVMQPVPAMINSDPTRYRQVLVNLIGNAIKFTHQGFIRVVISVKYPADLDSNPILKLSIQDTGIGIPKDKISRIFECFSQADTSTTRDFGGTGLGLSISRKICQMMGGDLTVTSEPSKGSTFTATFMVESHSIQEKHRNGKLDSMGEETALLKSTNYSLNPVQLSKMNVLVVDDAVDNRRLIDFILKKIGINGQFAENGQEALTMVHESQKLGSAYHIVFMDMHMPIMDGLTSTGILREEGFAGKIIALTANAMPQDRVKCLESGCDDFLTKPINRKKFEEVITGYANTLFYPESIPANTTS